MLAFVHRQTCEGVKANSISSPTSDSDSHRRESHGAASSHVFSRDGWTDNIHDTRIRRRLPGSRQHVQTKVAIPGGSDLDAGDPVNNWLHSLFSQVDVYLNITRHLRPTRIRTTPTPSRCRVTTTMSRRPSGRVNYDTRTRHTEDNCGRRVQSGAIKPLDLPPKGLKHSMIIL